MHFPSPYWNTQIKMELLQRWILVHSYLYYDLDNSIVSDHMFDNNCKQLMGFIEAHPDVFKVTRYYYAMKDFDGSSGYGMVPKLNAYDYDCVTRDAHNVLKWKE